MKTGIESDSFGWKLLNGCLYPFRKLGEGLNYAFGDSVKIIRQKENFFFKELATRSIEGGNGYATTYLGLPFLRAFSFFVFTGKDFVKEATSYGEYTETDPSKFDPKARSLFDPIKEFLGDSSIINMNGPEVAHERAGIKNFLTPGNAQQATWEITEQLLQNWSNHKSLNHTITYLCTQVIARAWFNIQHVPEELIPLLKTAEHYVFNRDQVSDADFQKLRDQIKAMSDTVLTREEQSISQGESYLNYLKEHRGKKKLTDLNALAALVVEGNITTVLTGAILQLATNQPLQERLRDELSTLDMGTARKEGYALIKNLPLLHSIYLESLRFFAPAPPMARYASKAGQINGVHIPARSYLFIPLRRIMHDPKLWPNPEVFDPQRHAQGNQRVNEYPLTPFSTGPRVCPASFGFAEAMFKIAIVQLFKENQLSLTSHYSVEQIPVDVKEPRFKQTYFGELKRALLPSEPVRCLQFRDQQSAISHKPLPPNAGNTLGYAVHKFGM
ncbi:MAG: cytochrome P450 [Candidatus Berkiella sp.]